MMSYAAADDGGQSIFPDRLFLFRRTDMDHSLLPKFLMLH